MTSEKKEKQLLVTVGTTKFEKLIQNIDTDEFYQMAIKHNLCGKEYLIRPSKFFKEEGR